MTHAETPARTFSLRRHPELLAVVRLQPGDDVPSWATALSLLSVTATATETSVVCAAERVPANVRSQQPFTAFEVTGPLDFAMTGVLNELLEPPAATGVSVFVLSTFDTDWILVPANRAEDAATAWRRRGHDIASVVAPVPSPPTSEEAPTP